MSAVAYAPVARHSPASRWTLGDLAAKVGADLGLPPDDEQRWILDAIYAEKGPDRPAAFEVCVVSPRQNIKTSTLGIAALADLFVFGVRRHVWSAHLWDTAKSTFADFRAWISSNPEYEEQVQFYEGHQDLSIVQRETRAAIEFGSRTGKAGRGLTGVKRVTLDEALYLEPRHIGAIYPTMLTQPGAQVRIASSAGLASSERLRAVRDRGRGGRDARLAYVEYGAERRPCADPACAHVFGAVEGCALDYRELWWQASCALWSGRITEESVLDLRRSMPPDEFAREMLSWWEDPPSVGGALDEAKWLLLADPSAPRGADPVFGVDVAEDRTGSIGVVWEREDGRLQVMLTADEQGRVDDRVPFSRVVDRLVGIHGRFPGPVVLGGPATDLADDLEAAGVEVVLCNGAEFAAACGRVSDAVWDGSLRHGNQEALTAAVRVARWRSVGTSGERAWQLKGAVGVGPLAAVTRAVHGVRAPSMEPFMIVTS